MVFLSTLGIPARVTLLPRLQCPQSGVQCCESKVQWERCTRKLERTLTKINRVVLCSAQVNDGATTIAPENAGPVREDTDLVLQAEVVTSIERVGEDEWNECATASGEVNPFLLWAFLNALEQSGSAVKEEGWLPQHVLIRSQATRQLLACMPLYLKSHSYGEYVFDSSWASMASRLGQRYYPKLQSCVPFTPVTGARVLIRHPAMRPALTKVAADTLAKITDDYGISGAHLTFNQEAEQAAFCEAGYLARTGIQYHWLNHGYASFDDFLMTLKQSKRNNIRKERRSVAAEGLELRRLSGADITPQHWDAFYKFYINTSDRKWGQAYLTRDFFAHLAAAMPERVLLVVAEAGGRPIAGALNLLGSHALFGRNWGCEHAALGVKHLHFEVCYYQALEAAIERGLGRVEAGAQGEHKIQRGYLPSLTYSSHYIRDPHLRHRVAAWLKQERVQVAYTAEAITQHASPYKDPGAPLGDSFASLLASLAD